MSKFKTIPIGSVFARLTVVGVGEPRKTKEGWRIATSLCYCVCGNRLTVLDSSLKSEKTFSCGCLLREITAARSLKHGFARRGRQASTYRIWKGMKQRCENPNNPDFHLYGGRGIRICKRWKLFEKFYDDMGDKPVGCSLDRIDCNGGYKPSNCRWADPKTQARNKRFSKMYTLNGVVAIVSEHCERLGLPYGTIRDRLFSGWSIHRALTEPIRHR